MGHRAIKMGSGGRLVIPADVRQKLGLEEGVVVSLRVENSSLRVQTLAQSMAEIQALVAQYVPDGVSLADQLIADRRAEVEAEND
jgi:AbrB family looped-hinge helix DNA binding protein